jgi:hypothetical protein
MVLALALAFAFTFAFTFMCRRPPFARSSSESRR